MTEEQTVAAVERCLDYMKWGAGGSKADRMAEFLATIHRDPAWDAASLNELQLRISKGLLSQARQQH